MACDLCGKTACGPLNQLRAQYRVQGVEDVCNDCERWANERLRALRDEVEVQMREAVIARRSAPPRPWWRRIFGGS